MYEPVYASFLLKDTGIKLWSMGSILLREWDKSDEMRIKSPITLKYVPLGQCAIRINGMHSFNR